jgi:hypothetical protein
MLWKRIAVLHLRDVDDIELHISSLRNALLPMPGEGQDQVHIKFPFVPPRPNAEQLLVHPYPDTRDHLLFTTEDDPNEARRHASRGLNPHDPYGNLKEPPIPAKVRTPTNDSADWPKLHGCKKRDPDADPVLTSQPLMEEAFDNMVPVREKRAFLGAVALPMTVAATAMGLFNRAQMEYLRCELFQ